MFQAESPCTVAVIILLDSFPKLWRSSLPLWNWVWRRGLSGSLKQQSVTSCSVLCWCTWLEVLAWTTVSHTSSELGEGGGVHRNPRYELHHQVCQIAQLFHKIKKKGFINWSLDGFSPQILTSPSHNTYQGFPDSSVGKESTCNSGDPNSIPGLGRSPGEGIGYPLQYSWDSLVAQLVKNPPAVWESWVWSLGWKDPLEKGKATHFSILAWRIPWTV